MYKARYMKKIFLLLLFSFLHAVILNLTIGANNLGVFTCNYCSEDELAGCKTLPEVSQSKVESLLSPFFFFFLPLRSEGPTHSQPREGSTEYSVPGQKVCQL